MKNDRPVTSLTDYLTDARMPRKPRNSRPPSAGYDYIWFWNDPLPGRKGQSAKLICTGRLNSCMLEFVDGWTVITSLNGVRKAPPKR
jgi:hypothetical protein